MNRSIVVALTVGLFVLSCVCVSLSCTALYFASAPKQQNPIVRLPFSQKPPVSPVVSPVNPDDGDRLTLGLATATGDTFLTALRDKLDAEAFDLFHPELQVKFVSGKNLGAQVDKNNVRPDTWGKWNSESLTKYGREVWRISTDVTFQGGSTGTAEFEIGDYEGGTKLYSFNLKH